MSAERFPADPVFPQLEVAGDPELMREVLQRHLRPLGEKTYQVRECRISQTRYRQASRCMMQYALRLEEPGTGHERTQWVTGLMHAGGRTRRVWRELRRSGAVRGASGASRVLAPFQWLWRKLRRASPERRSLDASAAFEPYAYVPELEMLVQVFPHDYRLPALPLMMEGPLPELESSLLARFGEGDWRIEAWDIEPVRYQAETRATLRLELRARDEVTGWEGERRFYAKIYREKEKGEQTYRVVRALWDRADAGSKGFTVGSPVAYLSDLRTLVQEEVPGTSFKEILFRGDEAVPAARKVARALAALHLDDVPTPQRRSPQVAVAELEGRGRLLRQACPRLKPEIEEILGAVIAGLEEGPSAPSHNDLGLSHIMLDGDSLALVDLDAFAEADPLQDVANILAQLAVLPLIRSSLPRERARETARVFVEEYFTHVPEAWRESFLLRYAGALLKRAAGLHKGQVPGWPEKIETLLEEARDSLAGKVW